MTDTGVIAIIEVLDVEDPEVIHRYQENIRDSLIAHGGRTLGEGRDVFEGAPAGITYVLQEWPSADAFRAWQASEAYSLWGGLRKRTAKLNITLVPKV